MSKRTAVKTLAEVSANLGPQDDQAAKDAQTRKLEQLQRINNPKWLDVPVEAVFTDYDFNPREKESYGIDANPELAESLKTYGIDPTKPPITLSRRSDGRYLVLRGNIRTSIILEMNADATRAGLPIPFLTVPAMVYEGLSGDDETLIMADHSGQKELNRYELSLMVGRASLARRWTDKEGSAFFGMSASSVQRLRQIFLMPPVLADLQKEVHYNKRKKAAGSSPVPAEFVPYVFGQTECQTLYNGYLKDQTIGLPMRSCDGPNFAESWAKVFAERENKGTRDKGKVRKATELNGVVDTYGESPCDSVADGAKLIAWAKGGDDETPWAIMGRMQAREQAKDAEIRDLTGKLAATERTVSELNLTVRRLQDTLDDRDAEMSKLYDQIKTLEDDRAALTAALPAK